MKTDYEHLTKEGIVDLGGDGTHIIEVEYRTQKGQFIEGFYRVFSHWCYDVSDIAQCFYVPSEKHTALSIVTDEHTFNICLPNFKELIELRLPSGDNIMSMFSCKR